jgi:DNA polymerase III subunit delta'
MTLQNELLPWLQHPWERLSQYLTQQRIPQALLIHSPKGLGKKQIATRFTFSLLCTDRQINNLHCGHCPSCLLLKAHTHPDFLLIEPEEPGKNITIGQIRSLLTQLMLKPQYEAYRVVVIALAEQMNNAAFNAFLKCLEEPNERTIIVLLSEQPNRLPATIISRCQKLRIAKPDQDTFFSWLQQHNINDNLELLDGLSQRAPLLAQSYANEAIFVLRNQCFNDWMLVTKQQNTPVLLAEQWLKLPELPLLFWMTSWVIDLVKCFYQAKRQDLFNPDLYETLQELAQQLELKRIFQLYDLLLVTKERLTTQLNKQAIFEEILIFWFELNQR